jgi:hypothetical protein
MALYLSALEVHARVRAGKVVEQWLGHAEESGYTVLKWLYIAPDRRQYCVTYCESFDEGNEEWHDVAAFSLLDPDADETAFFDSVEDAVAFAIHTHGASPERFVAGGMIQQEYAKYQQNK